MDSLQRLYADKFAKSLRLVSCRKVQHLRPQDFMVVFKCQCTLKVKNKNGVPIQIHNSECKYSKFNLFKNGKFLTPDRHQAIYDRDITENLNESLGQAQSRRKAMEDVTRKAREVISDRMHAWGPIG